MTNESLTLFIPLYGKALMSREGFLPDPAAEEIVVNMCHAELVHELIVVLSFTSLLFVIPFGSFWVFFITAVLAALLDCVFVLLQRYNRPRMVRLMEKQKQRTDWFPVHF